MNEPLNYIGDGWKRRRSRCLWWSRRGLNWLKTSITLICNTELAFVSTEVNDKILLVVFHGSAGCNLFKKSCIFSCLAASHFSWNSRCAVEFPLLPLHSSTAHHTISYYSSLPVLMRQQEIHINANTINWNWSNLVGCIKMKSHFFNSHVTINTYNVQYFHWVQSTHKASSGNSNVVNVTHSQVCIKKNIWCISHWKWSQTTRCLTATVF
jgi:hypothetical protein